MYIHFVYISSFFPTARKQTQNDEDELFNEANWEDDKKGKRKENLKLLKFVPRKIPSVIWAFFSLLYPLPRLASLSISVLATLFSYNFNARFLRMKNICGDGNIVIRERERAMKIKFLALWNKQQKRRVKLSKFPKLFFSFLFVPAFG